MSSTTSARHARSGDGVSVSALWDADPRENLTITTVGLPDCSARLYLTGALDFATAHLLAVAVDSVVAAGPADLRLDVGRVEFCDCAGLGALVRARRTARRAGGSLTLQHVTPQLGRIIGLLHLDNVLADRSVDATPHKRASGAR